MDNAGADRALDQNDRARGFPAAGRSAEPSRQEDEWPPALRAADDTDELRPEWSEEEIVFLHWRLLQELSNLADPATPLEDKLETLRWVFTEREKDRLPFSFASCLKVVGCSPLSPIAYCGCVDAEAIRCHINARASAWLKASLQRYPAWVRQAVVANPSWIERRLASNPQWINEQLRHMATEGDLFA